MLQGTLIIIAFLVIAALMMTKKIPTLLALPLMAVVICIIAGVPAVGVDADGKAIGWLQTVFEAGTVRMGSAIMAVIFGAWLGQIMNKTGITVFDLFKAKKAASLEKIWNKLSPAAQAEIDSLKDSIKQEMERRGVEELEAGPFIIRYTTVLTQRFDSTAFKKVMPDVYKSFIKQTASRRFSIN